MILIMIFAMTFAICSAALILSLSMGIHPLWTWLLTEPLIVSFVAAPWIGIGQYMQVWLVGKVSDPVTQALLAATLTLVVAAALVVVLPLSTQGVSVALRAIPIFMLGLGCMLLAVRRFERLDF
jgi:hypothetical protein